MGVQQILMIVLTVIVIGASITVGIQMYDSQANNQTRNAVVSDLTHFGVQAQAWYRLPVVMGGPGAEGLNTGNLQRLIEAINRDWTTAPYTNTTAFYAFSVVDEDNLGIIGTSISNSNIVVAARITLKGGTETESYGILIRSGDTIPTGP